MTPDLLDTIVALSSAAGPGARAVVRLSGPAAVQYAARVFTPATRVSPDERRLHAGAIRLPGVAAALPADLYVWPAPRSFTGQPMAELHTLSAPPLVERLVAELLAAGARAARPGEFTLRAFVAGKLDLTRAEAVLDVIEAGDRDELRQALATLAGGVARPLEQLRSDLLDLLADLEAGLDFAEEDIPFVTREDQLGRLDRALATLAALGQQLDGRALGGRPFRVVLAGRANAGKSSLFNALTGADALVSPEPGTTRDYLVGRLDLGGVPAELIDTAGRHDAADDLEAQAQALGREQTREADLVLLCVEAGREPDEEERERLTRGDPEALRVTTKCDLAPPGEDSVRTSAATGEGLERLRAILSGRARARARPAVAPGVSRCRHHVGACADRLRHARQTVFPGEAPELVALELRAALDELGATVGAVYTEDLLDRVFSRFCIGK